MPILNIAPLSPGLRTHGLITTILGPGTGGDIIPGFI